MKKTLLSLFVATVLSSALFAQQIELKGKVVNFRVNPIVATVLVKSSKEKVITDKEGLFTIKCNSKDKIKVTAKDYSTKTVKVNGNKFLVVKLKKSGIDYSQYLSFTDIMISIYSGTVIMESSEIYVVKRGLEQGNEALLILDGTVVPAITLITLSTNCIKSIKVLKDTETIMYGKRGSDGVVVVTTDMK
jgi:TonB-dependent SusC/RagA subfamily outer membrane receptor